MHIGDTMKKISRSAILFLTFIILIIAFASTTIYMVRAENKTEKNIVVYLDPGHGGFDGGAVSNINGLVEKELVLDITYRLKRMLEMTGYVVLLTRKSDEALAGSKRGDILKRVDLINNSAATLFISIHANSFPDESVHGAQVFYRNETECKKLSEEVQKSFVAIDKTNHRMAKMLNGKYLIEHTNKIGCLVEVGFLSNKTEVTNFQNENYLEKIAYAIYSGIIAYTQTKG